MILRMSEHKRSTSMSNKYYKTSSHQNSNLHGSSPKQERISPDNSEARSGDRSRSRKERISPDNSEARSGDRSRSRKERISPDNSEARSGDRSRSRNRPLDEVSPDSRVTLNNEQDAMTGKDKYMKSTNLKRSSSGTWKVKDHSTVNQGDCDTRNSEDTKYSKSMTAVAKDESFSPTTSASMKAEKRQREHGTEHEVLDKKSRHESHKFATKSRQIELSDRVFQKDTKAVVVLQHPESLTLRGKAEVRCLRGAVSILGYTMTASERFHPVYSPDTNSLLKISTTTGSEEHQPHLRDVLFEIFPSPVAKDIEKCVKATDNSVVLLMSCLESNALQFMSTIQGYRNIFQNPDSKAGAVALENIGELYGFRERVTRLEISLDHQKAADWLSDMLNSGKNPVVVVCGGKDVGKSTLARYLINHCLNLVSDVQFLDCDLGQTEFTIPGCVSLSKVTSPVLGPPFTHQRKPLCSCFVGSLSPGEHPGYYMKCLDHVYQKYSSEAPLIVNTMGWNKGMGLALLADTLRMVRPDLVVQLESYSRHKNMPPVDKHFLENTQGWGDKMQVSHQSSSSLTLMSMKSVVSQDMERQDRYRALDHRNLAVLSCLGECVHSGTIQSVWPYEVPWSSVAVHVTHTAVPRSQILYSLNASIVGLCTVHTDAIETGTEGLPGFIKGDPVYEYLGCGLVRGIDPTKKVFYLVTALTPRECGEVNCLVRGALEVPQQLLLNQKSEEDVPYVGYPKDGIGASSVSRRRHMVRRRGTPTQPT